MPRSGNEVDRGPVWQGGHLLPGDDPILKAEDHAHGNPEPIKIPYDVDPLAPVPTERFGKPQESAGFGVVGPLFNVAPGTYKAILERTGKPPHEKEVVVPAASGGSDHEVGGRWSTFNVVLD